METSPCQLIPPHRMRGLNITPEQVHRYAPSAPTATDASADGEERVLSFAELKVLIEQGKTDQIPHNKKIPDVVNVSSTLSFTRERSVHRVGTNCSKTRLASRTRQSAGNHGRSLQKHRPKPLRDSCLALACMASTACRNELLYRIYAHAPTEHLVNLLIHPALELFQTSCCAWFAERLEAEIANVVFLLTKANRR